MLDGYYTLSDEEMFALLYLMQSTQGIALEPSALAGAPGFARVLQDRAYRQRVGLDGAGCANATHLIWATGGGMVPEAEMDKYIVAGHTLVTAGL